MISESFIQNYGGIPLKVEEYDSRNIVYRGNVEKLGFGHEMYVEVNNNTKNKAILRLVETLKDILGVVKESDIISLGLIDNMGNSIYRYEKQGI